MKSQRHLPLYVILRGPGPCQVFTYTRSLNDVEPAVYAAQPGIESTGKEKLKKAKHHVFILFWFVGKAQTHIHWLQYFWVSVQFFGDCKCSWCFIIGFSEECLVFGYFKALVQWWISKELENHKWHFEVWFIYWISSFRDFNELDSLTFWWDASSTDRNPDFILWCTAGHLFAPLTK